MISRMIGFKMVKGTYQRRALSTIPPKNPTGGGPENNKYFIAGGLTVGAILFAAYKLETDPKVAREWKGTPGIGLLDPVRVIFREVPKP